MYLNSVRIEENTISQPLTKYYTERFSFIACVICIHYIHTPWKPRKIQPQLSSGKYFYEHTILYIKQDYQAERYCHPIYKESFSVLTCFYMQMHTPLIGQFCPSNISALNVQASIIFGTACTSLGGLQVCFCEESHFSSGVCLLASILASSLTPRPLDINIHHYIHVVHLNNVHITYLWMDS